MMSSVLFGKVGPLSATLCQGLGGVAQRIALALGIKGKLSIAP
ncbi:hypothetical protein [Donghicola sp.]|jgi:hypothetical protein|nr:hypothetical protein [Donghicola sp.]MCT4578278.1 hypothetical protein [Donghicola sp.]